MIIKANENILESINEFYKNNNISCEDNFILDADDIISIFSLISVKSEVYSMFT